MSGNFILKYSLFYNLFQWLVGGQKYREIFVDKYINAQRGDRILDLGCGTGTLLSYMDNIGYVGIDSNRDYIQSAKRRFGGKGEFLCTALEDYTPTKGHFDIVIAHGVLHHIDDKLAAKLFTIAHEALRKGGRLITLDGCYREKQKIIDRTLLMFDRGGHIRTEPQYMALAKQSFENVSPVIRDDMLRVPYTLLIMECVK